ncbi:PAS domain S-box protein [Chitinophaga lutea]
MTNLFSPLRTVLAFFLLASAWVLISNEMLQWIDIRKPSWLWPGVQLRGFSLVIGASVLLYFLLRRFRRNLLRSETAYLRIFRHNPQPMWIFDRKSLRFLAVNDAALFTYGYTREEFLTLTILDVRPKEDAQRALDAVHPLRAGYRPSGTWRHRRKDGRLMYVDIKAMEIEYQGHDAEIVSIWDLTDQHVADVALHEQQTLLNAIINSTDDVIWSIDREKRYTAFNRSLADTMRLISGIEVKVGEPLPEFGGEAAINRWNRYYERALAGEKVIIEEETQLGNSGVHVAEIVFNPIITDGVIAGAACFAHNITERKRYENRLKTALERYEIVSMATNDAIWDWNLQDDTVLWNPNVYSIFGYHEVGGTIDWWKDRVHPEDYVRSVESIDAIIHERKRNWSAEYRFLHADGSYQHVYDRGYVIYGEDGQPRRMIGAMLDIEEKKQYVEELKKVAFMSSHGLRRPVASMKGVIAMLDKERLDNPDNLPLLTHISQIAEEMDGIIHEVAEKCNAIFREADKTARDQM